MRNEGISNLALGNFFLEGIEVKVSKKACPNESPGLDCGHCMYIRRILQKKSNKNIDFPSRGDCFRKGTFCHD